MVARLRGTLAAKIHQPAVKGEMVAGILLGPSLRGWLWPAPFHYVFPAPALRGGGALRLFRQIGLCLFLFAVGMEMDVGQLRQQARTVVFVSQVSILFPYSLGGEFAFSFLDVRPSRIPPSWFLRCSSESR
jgi:Kef-type K+ transport system membrane component KefB